MKICEAKICLWSKENMDLPQADAHADPPPAGRRRRRAPRRAGAVPVSGLGATRLGSRARVSRSRSSLVALRCREEKMHTAHIHRFSISHTDDDS
jgi:hypothetical protein